MLISVSGQAISPNPPRLSPAHAGCGSRENKSLICSKVSKLLGGGREDLTYVLCPRLSFLLQPNTRFNDARLGRQTVINHA
ncbi:hypothetical protein KCU86_g66, partial [Aureobasidium melanogenum]